MLQAAGEGDVPGRHVGNPGPPELAEQHGDELAPAGEAPVVTLGESPLDERLELGPREQLENLAEHGRESVHGPTGVTERSRDRQREGPP